MIGDYRVTPESVKQVYENGLLTKPTPLHSMFRAGQGGFITGYKFIGDIYNKAVGLPENKYMKDTLQMIQQETHFEGQSFSQSAGNWVADMVGYSLNPVVLGLGAAGGIAARGLAAGARAIAPKAIIPFLERKIGNKTVGEIGERLTAGTLAGEFTGIPLAFEEGSASTAHMMGGIGFAISSIPVLLGLRKGLRKSLEKTNLETEISPTPKEMSESEKWEHDYNNKLDSIPNLESRATKILQQEGFEVNPVTHQVEFPVLTDKDVKNLQSAVTDSMVSYVSQSNKNNVIDYILDNRIDEIRSDPKSIATLQSYDDYIGEKLLSKENILKESSEIHENNMRSSLPQKSFLSQHEIYKTLKNIPVSERHPFHIPFTLPKNLEKKMKLEKRISELKKLSPSEKNNLKIEELQSKIPKILSPKEELSDISHRLIEKKEHLSPLQSRSYQRLQELSEYWPQARSLMERVNLEADFERQKSIKDTLEKIRKSVESPVSKSANPNNVINYLKERLEGMNPKRMPIGVKEKSPEQKILESSKVPSDLETITDEQKSFVDELSNKAPKLKEEFESAHAKIRQFKKSGKVLEDYIKCVLGAK